MTNRLPTYQVIFFTLLLAFFWMPSLVLAATSQCIVGSSCTIGEFLYDDDYSPITTATCNLTSKDPSGATFVNNAAMTAASDGFYSYSVSTTNATVGFYRTSLCCTSGTEYLCIDKSFDVVAAPTTSTSITSGDVESVVKPLIDKLTASNTTTNTTTNLAITSINAKLQESRILLEQLVNAPIIESDIESGISLDEKLEQTTKITYSLFKREQIDENLEKLTELWDNQLIKDLNKQKANPIVFASLIGSPNDTKNLPTLFGHLKYLTFVAKELDQNETQISTLLHDWSQLSAQERNQKISDLRDKVSVLNQIPQSNVLGATTNPRPEIAQKNETLYLLALVQSNKRFLSLKPNQHLSNSWLEEGSIIFKTVISNPSSIISQKVPLKFYLPRELKEQDIIKIDDELKIKYDTDKDSYYVHGDFILGPSQTRSFSIEVKDIWQLDLAKVESYRKQAEQLLEPVKDTTFFGQGASLKSDIDVALDKVLALEADAFTPEARIKNYREAQIELNGVEQKLDSMKTLVTSASSTGSIFGFVGGAQAIAVWGLVIILSTGFVFLALYMRTLKNTPLTSVVRNATKTPKRRSLRIAQIIFTLVASGSIASVSLGTGLTLKDRITKTTLISPLIATNEQQTPPNILGESTPPKPVPTTSHTLQYAALVVTQDKPATIYQEPTPTSLKLDTVSQTIAVSILDSKDDWSQIQFVKSTTLQTGWVPTNLLKLD